MALTPAELDPKTLERQADAAEASGDLEAALRLRFRAGLLRLDRRGAIEFRPSISTHEVRRAVRSEDFDAARRDVRRRRLRRPRTAVRGRQGSP